MSDDPVRVGDAFCFASTTGAGFGVVLAVNYEVQVAYVKMQNGSTATVGLPLVRLWRNALACHAA